MSNAWKTFTQFTVLTITIVAVLLALGYLPSRRLGGEAAVVGMLVGCAISLVASFAGTAPVLLARSRTHLEMVPAAMGAMATRIAVAVALAAAIALGGLVEPKPMLVWVVISHAALLVADTMLSIKVLSNRELAED